MPAPGFQHADYHPNPYEEASSRITEYTAAQIVTLQARLEKQLGPEYISTKPGAGGAKHPYITGEKAIQLANEVFGFNGWSSSIQNVIVDYCDELPQPGRFNIGIAVHMRITLKDGTYHEDVGYGHVENSKGKAAAFDKARKEGVTDGLKRALRNFGNLLGNCLYDKIYLSKIQKVKVEPVTFSEDNLHRHSTFLRSETMKKSAMAAAEAEAAEAAKQANDESLVLESYDEFFVDDFDDEMDLAVSDPDGHADGVVLLAPDETSEQETGQRASGPNAVRPPTRPLGRSVSAGSTHGGPQTPIQQQNPRPNQFNGGGQLNVAQKQFNNQGQRPAAQQFNQNRGQPQPQAQQNNKGFGNSTNRPQPQPNGPGSNNNNSNSGYISNNTNSGTTTAPNTNSSGPSRQTTQHASYQNPNPPPPHAVPAKVSFLSARAVKDVPEEALATGASLAPQPAMAFNPHADSPSIRKTPGIDHSKSKPVGRDLSHAPAKPQSTQELAAADSGGLGGARPAPRPANVVNPQFDTARRIGAPGGPGSPLANRNQYKPPSMLKRPPPGDARDGATVPERPPLSDVSNNLGGGAATGNGASGPDVKRQRVG